VFVGASAGAREVGGSLGDRTLHFFPHADGHAAVIGIDLETGPGRAAWRVGVVDAAGTARAATGALQIRARQFPVQRLTLPTRQVDLDPETERRAEAEAARLRALYDTSSPERLWRGAFTRPVGGDAPGHGFGAQARLCALQHRYQPALDREGQPIKATLGPIRIRFVR